MHLNWKRVDPPKEWTGFGINKLLLARFRKGGVLFNGSLDERLNGNFDACIATFRATPEFTRS